jgi:hypothetical protein
MTKRENRLTSETAPESAKTQTSVQAGSVTVADRCRFTDAPCQCGADKPELDDCREAFVDEVAAQIRRRREASYRLPPLPDGRRDPLDVVPRDGRST